MSNLPPRPGSPRDGDNHERRSYPDERDTHPFRSPGPPHSRYYDQPPESRSYPPARPRVDTYIPPAYDSRREEGPRRLEYGSSYRGRGGYRGVPRDLEREPRNWDRGRDTRVWESPSHRTHYDDRRFDRRRIEEPSYDSRRDFSPRHNPRFPPRYPPREYHPESYRRRSRSPNRRPPLRSPSPPYRSRQDLRPRSPPPPSPPPPKRIKLGNHSISTSPNSPRSRSPPHYRHRLPVNAEHKSIENVAPVTSTQELQNVDMRSRSATPRPAVDAFPAAIHSEETRRKSPSPILPSTPVEVSPQQAPSPTPTSRNFNETTGTSRHAIPSQEPLLNDDTSASSMPVTAVQDQLTLSRPRSPDPPKQPRLMDAVAPKGGPPGGTFRRRLSRSPPRGPRSHPRPPVVPPTGSATHCPTGPRAGWRQNVQATALSVSGPVDVVVEAATPNAEPELKVQLPNIPILKRESPTAHLDQEIARLESHRLHLASEYIQTAKDTRRALHEIDMVSIDLRAAERKRKIADVQLEKAKAGLLGVAPIAMDTYVMEH
ncbi:hypothetical protein BDQ12DRAFT_676742 [Crucibulum laeve]|uniref:Uncharacterized protein n=1 Tax=Crucibulum laeve TaxID=68775 RepID=A0A5C3MDA9_9AGAR|nr:hypothetical protein BDQ12DRAFT_676742 [Crucibulum laeve]